MVSHLAAVNESFSHILAFLEVGFWCHVLAASFNAITVWTRKDNFELLKWVLWSRAQGLGLLEGKGKEKRRELDTEDNVTDHMASEHLALNVIL